MMNPKIIRFYEYFDLSVPKMISMRPRDRGITPAKVELAAEQMFKEISSGRIGFVSSGSVGKGKADLTADKISGKINAERKIKPINLVREIWKMAEKFNDKEYVKRIKAIEDFRENFEVYRAAYEKLHRNCFILAVICILYTLYRIWQCAI